MSGEHQSGDDERNHADHGVSPCVASIDNGLAAAQWRRVGQGPPRRSRENYYHEARAGNAFTPLPPAVRHGAREEPLEPTPEGGTRPPVKPMISLHFR